MSDSKKSRENWIATIAQIRKAAEAKANGGLIDVNTVEDMLRKALASQQAADDSAPIRKGRYKTEDDGPECRGGMYDILHGDYKADEIKKFRKMNDDCVIASTMLDCDPRSLSIYKSLGEMGERSGVTELRKAMDTATSGEGSEWVPTELSRDLTDIVHLDLRVADLFNEIQMPTSPFDIPGKSSESSVKLTGESTGDGTDNKPTASTPGTRKVTLRAIKLMDRVIYSEELSEDSLIPILPMIKEDMADAMRRGWEQALLNGDTSGTHMDSDVTDAEDPRKSWNGLRKCTRTADNVSLSTFNIAALRSMRSKMGKYGGSISKLAYICSLKGNILMAGFPELITLDKYGPEATVFNGEVGKIDGIPVIISEWMRDDVNASGVNDSTTNAKGLVLIVYRPAFLRGVKRGITVKLFNDIERDQNILVTSWRGDFKPRYDVTTEPVVVKGVNLAV